MAKPAALGRFLDSQIAANDDYVGKACTGLGSNRPQYRQHLGETLGFIAFPILLRGKADTGAIGAAAHVRATIGAGAVPGGGDQLIHRQTTRLDLRLDGRDIIIGAARGHRILPDKILFGDIRPEIAGFRPMSRWVSLNQARAKVSEK